MDGWMDRSEVVGGGRRWRWRPRGHAAAAYGNLLAGLGTYLLGRSSLEAIPSNRFLEQEESHDGVRGLDIGYPFFASETNHVPFSG